MNVPVTREMNYGVEIRCYYHGSGERALSAAKRRVRETRGRLNRRSTADGECFEVMSGPVIVERHYLSSSGPACQYAVNGSGYTGPQSHLWEGN